MRTKVEEAHSFEDALRFSNAGSPTDCLIALVNLNCPQAVPLRYRALMQLNRSATVVDSRAEICELPEPAREEALMLLGAALLRSGDDEGRSLLSITAASKSTAIKNESAYHLAFVCWMNNDMDAASNYLNTISNADKVTTSKVIELQAWIEAKHGRYATQIELLKKALPDACVWNRAAILHGLSALVAEMFSPELAHFVRDEAERTQWTDDMATYRFQVMRNLGYCAALDGNEAQALKFFRISKEIAPSMASEVLSLLDRAYISFGMGCLIHAQDLVDTAAELAEKIAWENVQDDERLALLNLAKGMSHFDPKAAEKYLNLYHGLGDMCPTAALRNDVRRTAYELEAYGAVAKGAGRKSDAANAFKQAFQIYTRIGYRWRAALVVSRLLDLSYAGGLRSDYVEFLKIVTTQEFPRAWFTKSLGKHLNFQTDPRVLSLTLAQLQILDYLLQGMVHKDIANHLSIVAKTVANRATEIYRVFEVNTQSELIAHFVRNGLLSV